jgi:hypothetical protein
MPRPSIPPAPLNLPAKLDPNVLPRRPTRRQMVEIHRFYHGPIGLRSIEQWPIRWLVINGQATGTIEEFLAEAERRLEAARTEAEAADLSTAA